MNTMKVCWCSIGMSTAVYDCYVAQLHGLEISESARLECVVGVHKDVTLLMLLAVILCIRH